MIANHNFKFTKYKGQLSEPKLIYYKQWRSLGFYHDSILHANPGDVIVIHNFFDKDYLIYLKTLGWPTEEITYIQINKNDNSFIEYNKIKNKINDKKLSYLDTFDQNNETIVASKQLKLALNGNPITSALYSSKSDFRKLARKKSLPILDGYENLRSLKEIYQSLNKLFEQNYTAAVIKIDEGGGGLGQLVIYKDEFLSLTKYKKIVKIYDFLIQNKKYNPKNGVVVERFWTKTTASIGIHVLVTPDGKSHFFALHEVINKQLTIGIGHRYPCPSISKSMYNILKRDTLTLSRFMAKKGYIGYFALDAIIDEKEYYYTEVSLRKMGGTAPHIIRHKLFPQQDICFISRKTKSEFTHNRSFKKLSYHFSDIMITRPLQEGVFIYNTTNLKNHGVFSYICFAKKIEKAEELNELMQKRIKLMNK